MVDSLGGALTARRHELSPYEGHYLDRVLAWCRGDFGAAFASAQEMYRLAPRSGTAAYIAARSAINVNRPREALAGLRAIDPMRGDLRGIVDGYFNDLTGVLHRLESYQEELDAVARWLSSLPNSPRARWAEVRALIALGRAEEAERRLQEMLTLSGAGPLEPYLIMRHAAEELAAHGHTERSTELAARLADRLRAVPAGADSTAATIERICALFLAGKLDEASRSAEVLWRAHADEQAVIIARGRLAAAAGDRATALAQAAALAAIDRRYDRDERTLARAQIAAQLDDREEAVRLLREAISQGYNFLSFRHGDPFHADSYLRPLHGYPPYEELVKPKG